MISTHAPAGGATYTGLNDFRQKLHFYSRPCGRGDPTRFSRPNSSSSISTHAPAGGATPVARVRWLNLRSISTHAPAGGATRACVIIFVPVAFLLTPLREGRLHDPGADQDVRPISTHAPAGGATRCNRDDRGHGHISTHAPAGGATSGAGANGIARSHFYSRPCGRGDAHGRTYGSFRQISTHAPAGGATPPLPGGPTTYSFLLTPLREGRRDVHR